MTTAKQELGPNDQMQEDLLTSLGKNSLTTPQLCKKFNEDFEFTGERADDGIKPFSDAEVHEQMVSLARKGWVRLEKDTWQAV